MLETTLHLNAFHTVLFTSQDCTIIVRHMQIFNSSGPRGDTSPSHVFVSHRSLTNMAASEDLPERERVGLPCLRPSEARCQDWSNRYIMGSERQWVCFGWHFKFMLFILTLKSICILPLLPPPLNSTFEDSFSCFPVRTGIPNRLWLIRLLIFKN